jgi:hypothetical protein
MPTQLHKIGFAGDSKHFELLCVEHMQDPHVLRVTVETGKRWPWSKREQCTVTLTFNEEIEIPHPGYWR